MIFQFYEIKINLNNKDIEQQILHHLFFQNKLMIMLIIFYF